MKIQKVIDSPSFIYWFIAALMAVLFCLLFGVEILNPCYDAWLLDGGDSAEYYIGWKAYRNAPWTFPLGMTDNLAYPSETSTILTCSFPIISVFLKIFSPILPTTFQYAGIYGLVCFILQGVIAARIAGLFTENKWLLVLTSILFFFAPIFLYRWFYHASIAGHWMILLAMLMLFGYRHYAKTRKTILLWALLGGLAAGIHTYFVFYCGIVAVAYCIADVWYNKRMTHAVLCLLAFVAAALFVTWIFGGFDGQATPWAGGIRSSTMNLNAFINPQGWSSILINRPLWGKYQYEGIAYLGFGCILLLIFAVVAMLSRQGIAASLKHNRILIVSILLLFGLSFVLAVSPTVTLGNHVLFEYPLPEFIEHAWGIFRSTGRTAWICVYLIMLCSLIVIFKLGTKRSAIVIVTLCTALQLWDIRKNLFEIHNQFAGEATYESPFEDNGFWEEVLKEKEIEHIYYAGTYSWKGTYQLTNWAIDHGLTVSNYYFARSIEPTIERNLQEALQNPNAADLFVFMDGDEGQCVQYDLHYYRADDYIVGYTNTIDGFVPVAGNELLAQSQELASSAE